jgi:hypothetical protein
MVVGGCIEAAKVPEETGQAALLVSQRDDYEECRRLWIGRGGQRSPLSKGSDRKDPPPKRESRQAERQERGEKAFCGHRLFVRNRVPNIRKAFQWQGMDVLVLVSTSLHPIIFPVAQTGLHVLVDFAGRAPPNYYRGDLKRLV